MELHNQATAYSEFVAVIVRSVLTCGAEAQVRYPISRVDASTDISAALLYRRSACFQERVSLLQEVPAQQFYLRLLTPRDCPPQPF